MRPILQESTLIANDSVTFLLVDDLEENLLAMEGLLRREGLQLLKARTGPEALELLLVHDVALAIVDVQMPGMDGFELAELMRGTERTRRVPIIFVTAGAVDMQRRFRGYEAGAVDFLFKPIEPRILQSKADVFSELYRQRQEIARRRDELHVAADENARLLRESRCSAEALRELNATLESKVLQRTAELQHRTRQLQKLTLELSQAEDRERRRLATILHEDLQQQIAGARFHLDLLKGRIGQKPSQQAVLAKVDEMLRDAIEKSRGLSHELSPGVLHMNDLAEVLGWLAREVQSKHGLTVHVDIHGETTLHSEALVMFLFRAAREMLVNVTKHARVNEAVVRVRRRGLLACLAIIDRGQGFDPQELRETTGFGLMSIRERVELLGGRMRIRSAKGKGSRFSIAIADEGLSAGGVESQSPGARVAVQGAQQSAHADGDGQPPLRVLLVDDHEIMRQGLVMLLKETADIEVIGEASNGQDAIDLACRLRPDVVAMDVSMPVLSGEEATRRIKQHLPLTRIIALSMHQEPETVEKMHQAGADDYVLKTAPPEDLLAALHGPG